MSRFAAPLLTLALFGCAANRHLSAGDDLAAAGDWASALREYQAAEARRPHNEEIAGLVDEARAKAVADYLDAAGSALRGDDLGAAHQALEEARTLQPDVEEVAMLEDRLVAIGLRRMTALRDAGQTDDAYRLAARLHGWYARDEVEKALRDQRAAVRGEATALADERQFRDALARLDRIAEQEPRFASLEAWRGEVRARWADDLLGQARAHEHAGRLGSAYVAAASAAGVAGRAEDAMLRDRLRVQLVADYGLDLDLDVTGDPSGRAAFERAIDARVTCPAVTVGNFARPDLAVDVSLSPVRFDEVVTTSVGEQPYVSGWDEVPNPAYGEQRAVVDRVEGYVFDRELDLRTAREALAVARRQVELDRTALVPLQAAAEHAIEARKAAEGTETLARAALTAAQDAFDVARAAGEPVPAVADALRRAREAFATAHDAADVARAHEAAALIPRDAARAALVASEARSAEAERAVSGCQTALSGAHEQLAAERRHLDELPAWLAVERWDTFRYAIDHVERTASVAVSVRAGESTTRLVGVASTQDAAHGAFVRYGVPQDPLIFPQGDTALVALAWSMAAERASGAVDAEVAAWRADLVRDALASDGEDAARSWALVALADGDEVPPEFQRYLDVRWSGVSAEWVR